MATSTSSTSADRSSASARALAAATSTKARPSPLPTPQSATFPSSLQSPLPTPGFLQAERNKASMKTPLTPPPAYLDFLRNLDAKSLKSPLATSKSVNFSFSEAQRSPYPWPSQPASARPILNTQEGAASKLSAVSNASVTPNKPTASISPPPATGSCSKPHSRRVSDGDEPSSLAKCRSTSLPTHAKPPQPNRRPSLIIPESPKSRSFSAMSPPSAHVSRARSPATANAARSYYTTISPDGSTPRALSAPALGKPTTRPYCVRHVITRTVTYTRPAGTTASIPGVTSGIEAAASTGSRSTSSASGSEGRERTPKEDVMKLDTILNSTTDDPESGQKRKSNTDGHAKTTDSPLEQYAEARTSSRPSTKPLVGEVPLGKRRKVL